MDFTREPIIQTIITPKEGCKLVVRSSKNAGQEEYFVDAVEVVSFGQASFFRSLERPKPFLVPITDYEILEVREARMVLKNVGIDRSIKIGGGRESISRTIKGADKEASFGTETVKVEGQVPAAAEEVVVEAKTEGRPGLEKKRDRRRQYRKRRGGQVVDKEDETLSIEPVAEEVEEEKNIYQVVDEQIEMGQPSGTSFSSLLQPPPTLISETINRYRENALFKSAFFLTEEEQYKPHDKVQELLNEDEEEEYAPPLQEPVFADSKGLPERSFDALKTSGDLQPAIFNEASEETCQSEEESFQPVEEFYEPIEESYQPVEESYQSVEEPFQPIEETYQQLEEFYQQPTEEFVEEIKPLEEFGFVEQFEPVDQSVLPHQEPVLEEKPMDMPTSLSVFQEEDDEKFNEKMEDDHEKK